MSTSITKERLKELVKEVMTEESEYQAFFAKALAKAGKSINDMSDEEKKAFFNKVDTAWNGKGEKNEELTGGQKKLDVDKDGDIEADDLADLRADKKNEARDANGNEFPEMDDVKAAVKKMIQNNDVERLLRNKVIAYLQKEKGFTGAGNTNSSRLYDKVINDLLKH
jgi:hypothetical protein